MQVIRPLVPRAVPEPLYPYDIFPACLPTVPWRLCTVNKWDETCCPSGTVQTVDRTDGLG